MDNGDKDNVRQIPEVGNKTPKTVQPDVNNGSNRWRSRSLSVGHASAKGKNAMRFKSVLQGQNHVKLSGKNKRKSSKTGTGSTVDPRQSLMHQYFVPSPMNTNQVLVGSEAGNNVEAAGEKHENLGGLV